MKVRKSLSLSANKRDVLGFNKFTDFIVRVTGDGMLQVWGFMDNGMSFVSEIPWDDRGRLSEAYDEIILDMNEYPAGGYADL